MPLYRRLPKRGFNPLDKIKIAKINLEKIQNFIDRKIINSDQIINIKLLKELKIINKNSKKIKILGSGEIKTKINVESDLISKSAKEKLEKIGGSILIKKK